MGLFQIEEDNSRGDLSPEASHTLTHLLTWGTLLVGQPLATVPDIGCNMVSGVLHTLGCSLVSYMCMYMYNSMTSLVVCWQLVSTHRKQYVLPLFAADSLSAC